MGIFCLSCYSENMKIPKILGLDLLLKSYLFIPKMLFRKSIRELGYVVRGKTLDIGAGLKPFQGYFESSEYITLDMDRSLKPDIIGSILALPFPDQSLDSIVCLEVLEHIPDTKKAVCEIARTLRPGGILLLSAPMHWPLHYEPEDYFRFTKYGFYEILKNDFFITRTEKIGGLISFLGSRITEESALFLYRLFPFLPKRMRYALGHVANIPLSIFFYLLSLPLDRLFPQDAISWIIVGKKK